MVEILAWILSFERDFDALKLRLDRMLAAAQASLLRRILADILPALKLENGYIVNSVSNMAKANLIERVFDELGRDEMAAILKDYTDALLGITGKNAAYYFSMGFDAEKVAAIAADSVLIKSVVGIGANGEIIKDSFLYRLGRSDMVREQIKQYLLSSIATKQSLTAIQKGFSSVIKGNAQVDGALLGYWNNYAYDAFSKAREVDNLHFKDEIGLKHFVYQGGLIKTSRDFCRKKNGKVFSEDEARKNWPNDPDLIDKKHKSKYNPILDRGRYNCRHFLMWISEDMANELKAKQ